MGAYDNPKSYTTIDYTKGATAFNTTFQTGLAAGIAEGDKLIADRKKYEDTVYAQGEEMKKELSAAVDNGEKTKEQINTALEEFYAEALNVEQPTKKGLGGLFSMPTENRMDQKGMREAQNSFEGAVTPINTVLDYIYTSDMDIDENNDKGHGLYSDKKNIYNAIKNGDAKPTFKYDNKTKKFVSFIKVGNEIYDEARLQTIFTASGKEQRDIINAEHDDLMEGLSKRTSADLKNKIADRKFRGFQSGMADAGDYALKNAYEQFGLDKDGNIEPGKFTRNKLGVANNVYNNKLDLNKETKMAMLNAEIGDSGLSAPQKDLLLDLPLNIGAEGIAKKLGVDMNTANTLFEQSKAAKLKMVAKYTVNTMEDQGLFDEFYRNQPKETNTGGGGGGSKDNKTFPRQQIERVNETIINGINELSSLNQSGKFESGIQDKRTGLDDLRLSEEKPFNLGGITNITIGGTQKDISSSVLTNKGKIRINFEKTNKTVEGVDKESSEYKKLVNSNSYKQMDDTEKTEAMGKLPLKVMSKSVPSFKEYDLYDPRDMEKMYLQIGRGTSERKEKTASDIYATVYEEEFYKSIDPSNLNDPRMTKYRDYLLQRLRKYENKGLEELKNDENYNQQAWFIEKYRDSKKI